MHACHEERHPEVELMSQTLERCLSASNQHSNVILQEQNSDESVSVICDLAKSCVANYLRTHAHPFQPMQSSPLVTMDGASCVYHFVKH